MTVLGPVPVATLGVTLVHEHLHMDATPLLALHRYHPRDVGPFDPLAAAEARWDPGAHPDNYRFTQDDLVAAELRAIVDLGVRCVVDLTPPALGRDPVALAAIARASGVHVVMGTGHYLAPTHAPWVAEASLADIADALIREAVDGVAGTGIRPGILGEIGTGDPVHPAELRVVRAAAAAANSVGLSISVHLHPWGRTGTAVLDTLLAEGIPPDRIVLGHLTTAHDDAPYLAGLLDRGVRLGFDLFGFDHSLLGVGRWPPAARAAAPAVAGRRAQGEASQRLRAHDVGGRSRLQAYGGWGYGHLARHVVPLLREHGVDDTAIETMLERNPAELLTVPGA